MSADAPTDAVRAAVARGTAEQVRRWREQLAAGEPRVGFKIGITDPAVQRHLGLATAVVGTLRGGRCAASGGVFHVPPGAALRVEVEVAIRLGREVVPGEGPWAAREAIDALAPALEVVDVRDPATDLDGALARNTYHEGLVLGPDREDHRSTGPRLLEATVERGGEPAGATVAQWVPDEFGRLVALVADTLADHGERLLPGDRILSGAFTRPLPVVAGDRVAGVVEPLGRVEVRFE